MSKQLNTFFFEAGVQGCRVTSVEYSRERFVIEHRVLRVEIEVNGRGDSVRRVRAFRRDWTTGDLEGVVFPAGADIETFSANFFGYLSQRKKFAGVQAAILREEVALLEEVLTGGVLCEEL